MTPLRTMALGLALLMIGFFIPLLMIMRVIESTFLLNFLAYGASLAGLVVGMIGAAGYARRSRG